MAALWAMDWWSSPEVFTGCDTCSFEANPRELSAFPFVAGMAKSVHVAQEETVTLERAELQFSTNASQSTAEFVVCTQRPVEEGSLTYGMVLLEGDSLSEMCTDVRPLEKGTRLRVGPDAPEYLVALISPATAGRTHVSGLALTYRRDWSHGGQRGTQNLKQDVAFTAQ